MSSSTEASKDHARIARAYAAGATDALNLSHAFQQADARRSRQILDEAVDGLREALAHAVAARAALPVIGRGLVGLALMSVPVALLFKDLPS